jgi:TolB-like protein
MLCIDSLPEIARVLGPVRVTAVEYVVDGSVRRSGETVRIAARLVRADTGAILWSQVSDGPLQNMGVVQDEIASAVAAALTKIGAGSG